MQIYCGKEEIVKIAEESNQTLAIFFPISPRKTSIPSYGIARYPDLAMSTRQSGSAHIGTFCTSLKSMQNTIKTKSVALKYQIRAVPLRFKSAANIKWQNAGGISIWPSFVARLAYSLG